MEREKPPFSNLDDEFVKRSLALEIITDIKRKQELPVKKGFNLTKKDVGIKKPDDKLFHFCVNPPDEYQELPEVEIDQFLKSLLGATWITSEEGEHIIVSYQLSFADEYFDDLRNNRFYEGYNKQYKPSLYTFTFNSGQYLNCLLNCTKLAGIHYDDLYGLIFKAGEVLDIALPMNHQSLAKSVIPYLEELYYSRDLFSSPYPEENQSIQQDQAKASEIDNLLKENASLKQLCLTLGGQLHHAKQGQVIAAQYLEREKERIRQLRDELSRLQDEKRRNTSGEINPNGYDFKFMGIPEGVFRQMSQDQQRSLVTKTRAGISLYTHPDKTKKLTPDAQRALQETLKRANHSLDEIEKKYGIK